MGRHFTATSTPFQVRALLLLLLSLRLQTLQHQRARSFLQSGKWEIPINYYCSAVKCLAFLSNRGHNLRPWGPRSWGGTGVDAPGNNSNTSQEFLAMDEKSDRRRASVGRIVRVRLPKATVYRRRMGDLRAANRQGSRRIVAGDKTRAPTIRRSYRLSLHYSLAIRKGTGACSAEVRSLSVSSQLRRASSGGSRRTAPPSY